jgi:hypothetical protein
MITGSQMPSAGGMLKSSGLTSLIKPAILPKTNATNLLSANKPTTALPPQKVNVATLTPVTDISTLIGKKP